VPGGGFVVGLANLTLRFTAQTGQLERELNDTARSFVKTMDRLEARGKIATLGMTVPLGILGSVATRAAIDFEDSFAGIRKTVTVTGTSIEREAKFEQLEGQIKQLSTQIPLSTTELNQMGEIAGQLGVEFEDLIPFLDTTARVAATTSLSAEEAAFAISRLAGVAGLTTKDFKGLGSAIIELGRNFKTTEQDLVNMTIRFAGLGRNIGMSINDMLAFSAVVRSGGSFAESGGTAMARIFNILALEAAGAGKNMRRLNDLVGGDFAKSFEDNATQAIVDVVQGLRRYKQEGKALTPVIKELFKANVRTGVALNALINQVGKGGIVDALEQSKKAFQDAKVIVEASEERFQTTAQQLKLLRNNFDLAAQSAGQSFTEAIRAAIPPMIKMAGTLRRLADGFNELPKWVRLVTVSILTLGVIIPPVLVLISQMLVALTLLGLDAKLVALRFGLITVALLVLSAAIVGMITLFGSWSNVMKSLNLLGLRVIAEIVVEWKKNIRDMKALLAEFAKAINRLIPGDALDPFSDAAIEAFVKTANVELEQAKKILEDVKKEQIALRKEIAEEVEKNGVVDSLKVMEKELDKAEKEAEQKVKAIEDKLKAGEFKPFEQIELELANKLKIISARASIFGSEMDEAAERSKAFEAALNDAAKTVAFTGDALTPALEKIRAQFLTIEDPVDAVQTKLADLSREARVLGMDVSLEQWLDVFREKLRELAAQGLDETNEKVRALKAGMLTLQQATDPTAEALAKAAKKTTPLSSGLEKAEANVSALEDELSSLRSNFPDLSEFELLQKELKLRTKLTIEKAKVEKIEADEAAKRAANDFRKQLAGVSGQLSLRAGVFDLGIEDQVEEAASALNSLLEQATADPKLAATLVPEIALIRSELESLETSISIINGIGEAFDLVGKSITGTFSQSVSGILRGTQTIEEAWLSLGENLVVSFANAMVQVITDFIMTQAKQLAIQAATSAGIIKIKAAEATASSEEMQRLAKVLAKIAASQTATEAAESTARVSTAVAETTTKEGLKSGELTTTAGVEAGKTAAEQAGSLTRIGLAIKEFAIKIAGKIKEGVVWLAVEAEEMAASLMTFASNLAKILASAAAMTLLAGASALASVAFLALDAALAVFNPLISVLSTVMQTVANTLVQSFIRIAVSASMMAGPLLKAAVAAAVLAVSMAASSAASIPYIGWILAPIAAAVVAGAIIAAAAATAGLGSLAMQGGGIVPGAGRGDSVPTMLEPKEMVLPRNISTGLQNLVDNGGLEGAAMEGRGRGRGGGDTFIIQAQDAKSFDKFLRRNGRVLAKNTRRRARSFDSNFRSPRRGQ